MFGIDGDGVSLSLSPLQAVASLGGKALEDCDGLMEDMEVKKILRWWLGVSLVRVEHWF